MVPAVRLAADAALTAVLVTVVRAAGRPAEVPGVSGPTIAAYLPMAGEPCGPELPEALARALRPIGGRLLLPVLLDDLDLDWTAYDGPSGLRPAGRGLLREPVGTRLGPDAVADASLVIVPAVAVDPRTGVRLGRGGGSYDRALVRVPPGVDVVAPLYAGEAAHAVPAQPHDQRVSAILLAAPDGSVANWYPIPG